MRRKKFDGEQCAAGMQKTADRDFCETFAISLIILVRARWNNDYTTSHTILWLFLRMKIDRSAFLSCIKKCMDNEYSSHCMCAVWVCRVPCTSVYACDLVAVVECESAIGIFMNKHTLTREYTPLNSVIYS